MAVADPTISVVISARDAEGTIARTIDALMAQEDAPPYEVIVVDNASRDATGERAAAGGATVLRLDDRAGGPGRARNHGVNAARGEVIAFTDADCYPTPTWLGAVAASFQGADLVSGPIVPEPTPIRTHWDRTIFEPTASPLFATANLAVRRRDFLAAGGFEDWITDPTEAPSHPYGEDTVLAWKLVRAGARRAFASEAVVHHAVSNAGARDWIQRHREMENLPELVGRVSELRDEMLIARVFATRRTLAASTAIIGVAFAVATRRRWPLLALAPALWVNARRTAMMGPRAAAIWAIADVASSLSLIRGSVRSRKLVL